MPFGFDLARPLAYDCFIPPALVTTVGTHISVDRTALPHDSTIFFWVVDFIRLFVCLPFFASIFTQTPLALIHLFFFLLFCPRPLLLLSQL